MTDPSPPRTLLGWVLPCVLVGAAVFAHWMLNVPNGPLPPPVVKEDAPKKPDPGKTGGGGGGGDDDDKDKDDEPFTTPRSPGLLTQLWNAYDALPFGNEPTFEAWNVAHKPVVTQIVTATRLQLFKGRSPPPSITVTNIECHTIRCRFTLTGTVEEDLQALSDALSGLQIGGATLWHKFVPEPLAEEPAKRAGATPRKKVQIVVAFIRDLPPIDQITFKDGAPIKPPPPAIPPAQGALPAPSPTATVPTGGTTPPGAAPTAPAVTTAPTGPKPAKG